MAIVVGVNSWVTLIEADAYFAYKWEATEWNDGTLSPAQKESLLISAYRWINQQTYFSIPPASTANIVKEAQCEAAWYIYKYWSQHQDRRALFNMGVERFTISKFSESLRGVQFPEFIADMLDDFVTTKGGTFPFVERDFE